MAWPPPMSNCGSVMPCWSRMRANSPTMRRTAATYGFVVAICEPMWQCRPTSSRCGWSSIRVTACCAEPSVIDRPNFWSSVPVRTLMWAPAATPGTTRTITFCRVPAGVIAASRAISEVLSTTIRPTPRRSAVRRSSGLLALPCSTIRSGGKPVVTASASSPAEQTSRPSPSSCTQWAIARHRNALAA